MADLRAWAGVRADTGHAFDLMSEQSLLYAEEDYKVLEELALGPIGERPAVPNPDSWDAASGRLQRVVKVPANPLRGGCYTTKRSPAQSSSPTRAKIREPKTGSQ